MIRVRRLQRQNERNEWYDDAYALEDHDGQVTFCYNLTWDRVGARYNSQLKETGIPLDEVDTVLQPGDQFRWLPVEEIEDEQSTTFLEELDKRCAIPKPHSIADRLSETLAA
jgi:hypothetical protein